jgi:hypothetical protein
MKQWEVAADFVVEFFQWFIQNLLAHQLTHHILEDFLQWIVILGGKKGRQIVVVRLRDRLRDEDLVWQRFASAWAIRYLLFCIAPVKAFERILETLLERVFRSSSCVSFATTRDLAQFFVHTLDQWLFPSWAKQLVESRVCPRIDTTRACTGCGAREVLLVWIQLA